MAEILEVVIEPEEEEASQIGEPDESGLICDADGLCYYERPAQPEPEFLPILEEPMVHIYEEQPPLPELELIDITEPVEMIEIVYEPVVDYVPVWEEPVPDIG